jgi:undecaprenyl-diphosphatase
LKGDHGRPFFSFLRDDLMAGDPISLVNAVILGIVEGVTEFLPISSTGHLIVAASLLGIHGGERAKVFEIAIQIGAIFAVLWAYRDRFWSTFRGLGRDAKASSFSLNLCVAFVPAATIGFLFIKDIKAVLFNAYGVAAASIIGALIILWVERNSNRREADARIREVDAMTMLDAFKVGLAQCFSLFPGMSRSGASLVGGMLFGMSRKTATEFSFFLGVPTLSAASLYSMYKDRALLSTADIPAFAVGTIVSFIVALVVIRWLIRFVATHTLVAFAWYRIAFGVAIFAAGAAGWVTWPAK